MVLTLIRRILLIAFIGMVIIGSILLLNFSPNNPTWRRYSSGVVDVNGSPADIGIEGENMLARDLRLPVTNERASNTVCVCNIRYEGTAPPNSCNVCSIYSEQVSNYRIPDFVTNNYIAESKNARQLAVSHSRDFQQIQEMTAAAKEAGVPVWIYVRTESYVDDEYNKLAGSTGGGVIRYFREPTYTDPVDQIARILLIIGGSGIAVILGWEVWRWLRSETPNETDESVDVIDEAVDTIDETEGFMRRIERLSRKEIDKKDDRKR